MGYSQKVHKRGYMKKEFHSHNRTTGIHCWANLTTEQLRNLRSHATFECVHGSSHRTCELGKFFKNFDNTQATRLS